MMRIDATLEVKKVSKVTVEDHDDDRDDYHDDDPDDHKDYHYDDDHADGLQPMTTMTTIAGRSWSGQHSLRKFEVIVRRRRIGGSQAKRRSRN